jgi:biopolymer transport protein ExbB/TolQ
MTASPPTALDGRRRPGTTLAAFLIGLPLAAGILAGIHRLLPHDSIVVRYVHHPVENVEVVLFCCALGALLAKLWQTVAERGACRAAPLPAWDGKPVAVAEAPRLLSALLRLPRRLHCTWLAQRVRAVLDFLRQRGSADELDDQMRALADNDGLALENSYALTRFITWAIPILGFLGTVLGITGAIAGISPKDLENSDGIGAITGGLALSFDATALALALTMITMFFTFLVERAEQGVLDEVDRYVDTNLAHRFVRRGLNNGPVLAAVEAHTHAVLDATEKLVRHQAEVWAGALAGAEKHAAEKLASALDASIERTLKSHGARLAELEKRSVEQGAELLRQMSALAAAVRDTGRDQQAALSRVADGVVAQASGLMRLQENEKHLLQLQAVLQQNLNALAGAGAFEQAVHSLSAAIHLLTGRVAPIPVPQPQVLRMPAAPVTPPPGKAA